MESEVLAEPVLVGRDRELEELRRYLELATEGKGKTVFISAEAGVGKTRLLQEFVDSAKQDKNTVVLSGWCLFNAGVPYFPFIEAFSNYYSTLGKKSEKEELKLSSWLKSPATADLANKLKYLSPQALKDQTFIAVAKTIKFIASQKRVILAIEDIHWADSASLALLHYIARVAKNSERFLVLATYRSEELTHDSEGYPHPLVETLAIMRREDLFAQISLPKLNPSCVTEMAESMLKGSLQQSLAEKLAGDSEGNPLFVVESLRMLKEHKDIVQMNNEWRLAVDELRIPSKFKDIMLQRVACLNFVQRRLLDAASVIGDDFEVGLLSVVVEQDTLDVLETLNIIANRTSLVFIDENRFRFDHSKSREIIYEALPQPLRLGYHARIAEKLEKMCSKTLPLSDLAFHYSQAGNTEKAIKFALTAAKDELNRWSNAQAINHFLYVLKNIPNEHSEPVNERVTALEGLGDAFRYSQKFRESINAFEELANMNVKDSLKIRALRKAGESAFELGDARHLMEIVRRARLYARADPVENARVLMIRALAFHLQRDWSENKKNTEAALKVFEANYSLWDLAWSLMELGSIHGSYVEGMKKKGVAESLLSAVLFGELGDFHMQMIAYIVAGTAFNSCLLEDEASKMFANVLEIEEKIKSGDYLRLAIVNGLSTWPLILKGNLEEALAVGLKSLEFSKKTDSLIPRGQMFSRLTLIYALMGDFKNAEKYFEQLKELDPEIFAHEFVNGFLARAIFYSCKGQWSDSERCFRECYEWLKTSPIGVWKQIVGLSYAWALERQGRNEEAVALIQKTEKTHSKAEEKFNSNNLQVNLLVPSKVKINESFEIRFYLSNISRKRIRLIKAERLIPDEFTIASPSSFNITKNGSVDLMGKELGPFQIESIKVGLQATKGGIFYLAPKISYVDILEKPHTCKSKKVCIKVKPAKNVEVFNAQAKFEFKSEAAEKAFNYLITASIEDRLQRKLSEEKSGWRTLTEISRNAHIPKYSMYGRRGRGGETTRELRLMDTIESRFFAGERGRGGNILKIRILIKKLKHSYAEQK